ncbi:hypothetical protein GOP47_0014911 [Adiantum capillus-veneris]|uniref:ABC transporter domain-containing protein n=1 Tax=Adiantum capillus-veneris TaxID=13818 RepID=A0A9D4ZCL7_ADICA|nr:hypothetical protein GOP47_0014911 [Adiantum capillus-veneris]
MGDVYLDVEAAAHRISMQPEEIDIGSTIPAYNHAHICSINVEDNGGGSSNIILTRPNHDIMNDVSYALNGADLSSSTPSDAPMNHVHLRVEPLLTRKGSSVDALTPPSSMNSWLSLLGSGGDLHKGRSEQQRSISTLHAADDALLGRITANSGVSFCISRCSLQSPSLDATKPQVDPNVNSAVVRPAPYQACGMTSSDIRECSESHGMVLTFVDVSYTLAKKRRRRSNCGRLGKKILHGITGSVMPGEMLALMGPSGSGKTTLLNLLGGRHNNVQGGDGNNTMKGTILYDGAPYNKALKPRMGFVTQDDILYPHLTVRETLLYAALLRLPATMSRLHKSDKADQISRQLGLERCRDTIIGNAFVRGVSGGERKRVCIGHEILIDPSLIFLDEPTSGLDSTTALRIMSLLQGLAKAGRSVVTTIHQPSSRAFYLFDKLLLLTEGHCVYFGKAHNVMSYFEGCGFAPMVPMNPADFILDLCSGNISDMKVPLEIAKDNMQQDTFKIEVVEYLLECKAKDGATNKQMRQANLEWHTGLPEVAKIVRREERRKWAVGWSRQVAILLERGLKERRHDYLGWLKVTQVMATSLLCGALWWHSNPNSPMDLEDQVGLLFFIGLFWGFFPLFNAIFTFPLERAILAKERSSDMYRLSAYFIARSASDLPLDLLLPTCFLIVVYFMATLRLSMISFLYTTLAVHLTVITAQGVGLLIGAALMDVKKATTFGSVLVIALMLAAGFFVQHIPNCVAWIKYFSFQSYCYKLLVKIQYYPDYNLDICSHKGASSRSCKQALSLQKALHGMQLKSGLEEVWSLLALSLASRILAYLALRRLRMNPCGIGKRLQPYGCFTCSKHF